jgi:hypothetical protein
MLTLSKLSEQFGKKNRPLRKKLTSEKNHLVCVNEKTETFNISSTFLDLDLERFRGENKFFPDVPPLFSSFCTKLAKIWQQICRAAPLFVWPLLRSTAKQSAS